MLVFRKMQRWKVNETLILFPFLYTFLKNCQNIPSKPEKILILHCVFVLLKITYRKMNQINYSKSEKNHWDIFFILKRKLFSCRKKQMNKIPGQVKEKLWEEMWFFLVNRFLYCWIQDSSFIKGSFQGFIWHTDEVNNELEPKGTY